MDCTLPANFLFTLRNTQVSFRQEAMLKVNRCAKVITENHKVLEMVIMPTDKIVSDTENIQTNRKSKTRPKENERPKSLPVSDHQCEVGESSHALRLFTDAEIDDENISRLEKERRCFWNNLAPKISSHPKYKRWSLQARNGIIDTEWMLRKAELLKIEAEQVLKIISTKNDWNHSTTEEEKKISWHLDSMLKVDFKRNKIYREIENLHEQLKHPGIKNICPIENQIRENETTLDKSFTELKSSEFIGNDYNAC